MLAVDWGHKSFAIYDGRKVVLVDRQGLIKRATAELQSAKLLKSKNEAPVVVIEENAPINLVYELLYKVKVSVMMINPHKVKEARERANLPKNDEVDARIIYSLAQENPQLLFEAKVNEGILYLKGLYHRYLRIQKARVALGNSKTSYMRFFGSDVGKETFDNALKPLEIQERELLKEIKRICPPKPSGLDIRGLGPRIWVGILVGANPTDFPSLSSYLRYCGFVDKAQLNNRWSRHANSVYHILADSTQRLNNEKYRGYYIKFKEDIALKHPEYNKAHLHKAALNRVATFLAKEIWGKAKISAYC